ncbi:MAG TPA: HDIG domain-containing protein [Gemmatimonadota bacterium]|nr:HDIG domain-containing protein [Gemmatimonadota bacterium]
MVKKVAAWRSGVEDPAGLRDLVPRVALIGLLALLTLVLFPPPGGYKMVAVRVGVVAPEDIIAPFDFPVRRAEEALTRLQEEAAHSVAPVYTLRTTAADSAAVRLLAFIDRFERLPQGEAIELDRLEQVSRVEGRSLGLRAVELRALADPESRDRLRAFIRQALPAIYSEHRMLGAEALAQMPGTQIAVREPDGSEEIIPKDEVVALEAGAEIPVLDRLAASLDPETGRLALQLIPALAPSNLEARPALTAVRREEARRAVSPIRGEVLRGELIVGAHTRVTQEQAQKLASLSREIDRRRGGFTAEDARAGLGTLFLNMALLSLFGFYLYLYRRDVFADLRAVSVLVLVWGLVTGLAAFVHRVESVPDYAVPISLGSVLVAVLWDARLSAVVTLFLAIYVSAQGDLGFPLLWTGLLGGLAGSWSVRCIRRRTHFYETLLFITAGHALALAGLALTSFWGWTDFGIAVGWGTLSAALAVFLAMGLLPVLEWASGRTTDLTLLELADLNRPLLKQLLLEAPGTYHHSIIVGNLAEAAAEEIGGNSLLARVGAYYHDIGKIPRPEYFVENQRQGWNPHNALPPEASARIVSRHVQDGVTLARAAGLPERVIDFIREHHGTTRLTYFWQKAEEEGPVASCSPGDFVYPGPCPGSKETAVVMLADSVEAASRVVREPTPDRFREVVRRIIEMKLDEHQLDKTDLTFRDLAIVEAKFVGVLTGIHHHRIDYPTLSLHAPEVRDDAAGPLPSVGRSPA